MLLAFASHYYFTHSVIYIQQDGFVIKNRLKQIFVGWDDVISMASVVNSSQYFRYEIKTNARTISIPLPENWAEFEKFVVEKAGLEIEGESMVIPFSTSSPRLKRWRKIGKEYVITSSADRSLGIGYINEKNWKSRTILGGVLFLVGLLLMAIVYMLNNGA